MARDDDRDRVSAVRETDRPDAPRMTDCPGDVRVRRRAAVADFEQRVPHPTLERRALRRERHVELAPDAGEVLAKLPGDALERARILFGIVRRTFGPRPCREADLAQ